MRLIIFLMFLFSMSCIEYAPPPQCVVESPYGPVKVWDFHDGTWDRGQHPPDCGLVQNEVDMFVDRLTMVPEFVPGRSWGTLGKPWSGVPVYTVPPEDLDAVRFIGDNGTPQAVHDLVWCTDIPRDAIEIRRDLVGLAHALVHISLCPAVDGHHRNPIWAETGL